MQGRFETETHTKMKLCDCLFQTKVSLSRECLVLDDASYLSFGGAQVVLKDYEQWLFPKLYSAQVVGFLAYNSADFFFSVIAATNTMAPALLNTRWTPEEIAAALMSGPKLHGTILLLHDAGTKEKATAASRIMQKCGIFLALHEIPSIVSRNLQRRTGRQFASAGSSVESHTRKTLTTEDALIVFTSGTTSSAKGVRLGHNAIFCQARVKLKYYNSRTRLLASTLPFYHIGGISSILATWLGGGCLVLNGSPTQTLKPSVILGSVRVHSVNVLVVVPAILHSLQQVADNIQLPGVKLVLIGGQSASETMLIFARKAFPAADIVQTFACTEAASSLTFLDVTRGRPSVSLGDCVGKPSVAVAICKNKALSTKPWSIGRICTRGPHVMNGYWGHEPHNCQDWYTSNDLGCFDDQGRLIFCGRTTDTIRTGGETVFSAEVERTLLHHPSVKECAVFGDEDDHFGECVCAAIVFEAEPIEINSLRSFCGRKGLAGFKQPRLIFAVQSLPKNASGKVLKRVLKQFCNKTTSSPKPQRSKL